jgi:DNA modification methylase
MKRTWAGGGGQDPVSKKIRAADAKSNPQINSIYGRPIDAGQTSSKTGVSIFDPVLTELLYKWFVPKNGSILDPFAGGSVRGIIAAELGFNYLGVDLRKEQIEANNAQALRICKNISPIWVCDDSKNILNHAKENEFDFVFSCPPYGDLEVYSDDPKDISTMAYDEFKSSYFEIIQKTTKALKPDSFAAFVVGEFRDKKTGNYQGLVPDTIAAFKAAGLDYYNEMILVTSAGSLPLRAGKAFAAGRKIGKTHQNILVFLKGSSKKAVEKLDNEAIAQSLNKLEALEPRANALNQEID